MNFNISSDFSIEHCVTNKSEQATFLKTSIEQSFPKTFLKHSKLRCLELALIYGALPVELIEMICREYIEMELRRMHMKINNFLRKEDFFDGWKDPKLIKKPRYGSTMIRAIEEYLYNTLQKTDDSEILNFQMMNAYSCFRNDIIQDIEDIVNFGFGNVCLSVLNSVLNAYTGCSDDGTYEVEEMIFETESFIRSLQYKMAKPYFRIYFEKSEDILPVPAWVLKTSKSLAYVQSMIQIMDYCGSDIVRCPYSSGAFIDYLNVFGENRDEEVAKNIIDLVKTDFQYYLEMRKLGLWLDDLPFHNFVVDCILGSDFFKPNK